jgi:NAD(P)-dependent dehydrogenase (short-subunit alcohol dehydrogenase family)
MRQRALITGAAGGMGRACARLLGASRDLVLTDVTTEALQRFADELASDGYAIAGVHAGDLASEAVLEALTCDLAVEAPFTIVHTAGLSPSQADWRRIMDVNLVATERLLRAVEPLLRPESVAVLIASGAGHFPVAAPQMDALLADPLAPGFLDLIGAGIETILGPGHPNANGMSYMFSKRALIRLCERRAEAWGRRGARIVSISPGLILTPMGKLEREKSPLVATLEHSAPAGRPGSPMEIAFAARFLASDEASFITGCDLRVDGGGIAAERARQG